MAAFGLRTIAGVGLAAALTCASALPAMAAAKLYGLTIGIDNYLNPEDRLDGAVNDAEDVAQALTKAGAAKVIKLLDRTATKAAIENSWKALVDEAESGDTLVFHYAGHGSQEKPAAGAGAEEIDKLNENFILANFQVEGEATNERIVDDEMNAWLKMADDKGVRVIFIADACHSGGMTRSATNAGVKFRELDREKTQPKVSFIKLPTPAIAAMKPEDFKNVTFVAGVPEDKKVPEVRIDGHTRGALSWAFSRALEGNADVDRNGIITQAELASYIVPAVHEKVESQQTPVVLPLRSSASALIALSGAEPDIDKATDASLKETAELKLAVIGGKAPADMPGVAVVTSAGEADLVWDAVTGQVEHRVGGLVAEKVDAAALAGVLTKWRAIAFLQKVSGGRIANLAITSGTHRHKRGEQVSIVLKNPSFKQVMLFNLPPNGRVELFLPERGDETRDFRGKDFSYDQIYVAEPPFGAEHLVAILSEEPLTALADALKQMNTPEKAGSLPEVLEGFLKGKAVAVGIAQLYTAATPCSKAADAEGARCVKDFR